MHLNNLISRHPLEIYNEFRVWDNKAERYDNRKFAIDSSGVLLLVVSEYAIVVEYPDRYTIERKAGETYDGKPVFDGDKFTIAASDKVFSVCYCDVSKRWLVGGSNSAMLLSLLGGVSKLKVIGTIHDKAAETA